MEGEEWDVPSLVIVPISIKTRRTFNVYSVLSEHSCKFCILKLADISKGNMKAIVVVFAFCIVGALALTDEQKTKLTEYRNLCTTETGVDPEVVDNAKKGNIAHDDEKLGCFAACMLKKIQIVNQDGTVNTEIARQRAPPNIPKDQVDDVINKCKDTTGPNECRKAANLVKCFVENKSFHVL